MEPKTLNRILFRNMLRTARKNERLYMADISLLILDEVHHCNLAHVYNKIMQYILDYPHPQVRPQVS